MRRVTLILLTLVIFVLAWQGTALAAFSWRGVVNDIDAVMQQSLDTYRQGDVEKAKEQVNEAYFGFFEKEGMERAILSNLSGRRASELEYKFSSIKKLMRNGAPVPEVERAVAELTGMLREDAAKMDGPENSPESSPVKTFLSSFLILVREGFEAILIIGAIAAYLIKSGNSRKVGTVYRSAALALLASILTAVLFQLVFSISGASQELLEGLTMLLATLVLFSVSHWMVGKAQAGAWQRYINEKVQSSLSSGSTLALGAAVFLAVYREGAETVLFYQALIGSGEGSAGMVWLGFALGCLALAAIFAAVRYGSMKIPLKPFFLGTSALLYYLAFVFAGQGVQVLQLVGLVGVTQVPGLPTIAFLGIYPTLETLLAQSILLGAAIGGVIYQRRKAPSVKVPPGEAGRVSPGK